MKLFRIALTKPDPGLITDLCKITDGAWDFPTPSGAYVVAVPHGMEDRLRRWAAEQEEAGLLVHCTSVPMPAVE